MGILNKKDRKESEPIFNHTELNIEEAIGVTGIVGKADNSIDRLSASKFQTKSEMIEFLYNLDKIELAIICSVMIENVLLEKEEDKIKSGKLKG